MNYSVRSPQVQSCRFRVHCDHARLVKLVIDFRERGSHVFSLEPQGEGLWETTLELPAGVYRFCYHLYDGRSLTYLIPDDCPMDGLKAVLRVRTGESYATTAFGLPSPALNEARSPGRMQVDGGLQAIGPDQPVV